MDKSNSKYIKSGSKVNPAAAGEGMPVAAVDENMHRTPGFRRWENVHHFCECRAEGDSCLVFQHGAHPFAFAEVLCQQFAGFRNQEPRVVFLEQFVFGCEISVKPHPRLQINRARTV